MTKNMIKLLAAISCGLIIPQTQSDEILMEWGQVYEDTEGILIDTSVISYRIYINLQFINETSNTFYLLSNIPEGCYNLSVTAFRNDANLESVQSNSISKCVEPDDSYPVYPPEPPYNVNVIIK